MNAPALPSIGGNRLGKIANFALPVAVAALAASAAYAGADTTFTPVWPVLGVLGWKDTLRQQNLTVSGRDDVPDGLLFADADAKAAANAMPDQSKRYACQPNGSSVG